MTRQRVLLSPGTQPFMGFLRRTIKSPAGRKISLKTWFGTDVHTPNLRNSKQVVYRFARQTTLKQNYVQLFRKSHYYRCGFLLIDTSTCIPP